MLLMGKPKISICKSVDGAPSGDWKQIDTPVEGSVSLETSDGDVLEAREEGGEMVDRIQQASSYTLTLELYKKEKIAFPLPDTNGVVAGEYAVMIETDIPGRVAPRVRIDRAVVTTSALYSVNDTLRKRFTFSALKPASGDTLKILDHDATEELENDITSTSTEPDGE